MPIFILLLAMALFSGVTLHMPLMFLFTKENNQNNSWDLK
jgi:hypothetical protein